MLFKFEYVSVCTDMHRYFRKSDCCALSIEEKGRCNFTGQAIISRFGKAGHYRKGGNHHLPGGHLYSPHSSSSELSPAIGCSVTPTFTKARLSKNRQATFRKRRATPTAVVVVVAAELARHAPLVLALELGRRALLEFCK